jgi:hypothetical protein
MVQKNYFDFIESFSLANIFTSFVLPLVRK